MTKDQSVLLALGLIIAAVCVFTAAALSWRGRIALVLLSLATLFVWIAPEATGEAVIHTCRSATRWIKSVR